MSTENDDHDGGEWDERSDLTRLEDLSEFLHEEDPDVEAKLKAAESSLDELPDVPNEGEDLVGLSDLEDDNEASSLEEDTPASFDSEDNFDSEDGFGPEEPPSFSEDQTAPDLNIQEFQQVDQENDNDDSDFQTEPENQSEDQFADEDDSFSEEQSFSDDNDEEASTDWQTEDYNEGYGEEDGKEDDQENNFQSAQSDFTDDGEEFESHNFDNDQGSASLQESEEGDSFEASSFENEDEDENQLENEVEHEDEDDETANASFDDNSSEDFSLPEPQELEERPVVEAANDPSPTLKPGQRENFQDLRDFGNAITYGVVTTGGNPPYSLILRQVKFEEDAEDIKIVLREHGLLSDDNEETITQGLEQGSLLISQISEYSAIYLAHKLRHFDVELRIGLSDQLHPSKSYSREGKGLVSKYNLRQNHRESLINSEAEVDVHDIKMATTPTLDGYNIHRYIDVITSHTLIEEEELKRLHKLNQGHESPEEDHEVLLEEILGQFPSEELESPIDQFDLGLNEIYKELVIELRNEAFKVEANGVVGINFNITPMMFRNNDTTNVHYKITCSGNAVWIVDHQ